MTEPLPVDQRFERHVDRSPHPLGCHLWTGAKNEDGYGIFGWGPGETMRAHRAAWRIMHGEERFAVIQKAKSRLLHRRCDNPSCVNAEHVDPGTQRQNMADRKIKGRWAGGRPRALSTEQRAQVARRIKMGESVTTIARTLGVSRATIRNATNRGASHHV